MRERALAQHCSYCDTHASELDYRLNGFSCRYTKFFEISIEGLAREPLVLIRFEVRYVTVSDRLLPSFLPLNLVAAGFVKTSYIILGIWPKSNNSDEPEVSKS